MKYFLLIMLFATIGAGSAFAHHESGGRHSMQAQAPATDQYQVTAPEAGS